MELFKECKKYISFKRHKIEFIQGLLILKILDLDIKENTLHTKGIVIISLSCL